jgi:site-specific recombinase XerD
MQLSPLIQGFFAKRLVAQLNASEHTISAYRDTFKIFLGFASARCKKAPVKLTVDDVTADCVGEFLEMLETERGNTPRTRNARLAAIRSFFKYVAINEPSQIFVCQRVLAMPSKRYDKLTLTFLNDKESNALLAAPDKSTWLGRRDHLILLVALRTGFRVSELVNLNREDVQLDPESNVRCVGKGRKERVTPVGKGTAKHIRAWLNEERGHDKGPLFTSRKGGRLSCDAVQGIVARHSRSAAATCPSMVDKRVSPHVLRHSAAMALLLAGNDPIVIALWLGHSSLETTQIYIHADMRMKERALAKLSSPDEELVTFKPDDTLMAFLDRL